MLNCYKFLKVLQKAIIVIFEKEIDENKKMLYADYKFDVYI